MRTPSTQGGAITATVLTLIGIGIGVVLATDTGGPSTSAASESARLQNLAADSTPTAVATTSSPTATSSSTATSSETASASSSATSTASDGSECADVYKVDAPTGDSVGKLCTAVTGSGTTISKITVTFTATSSCSGSVMLRASGVNGNGVEFGKVDTVSCTDGEAAASFTSIDETTSGTDICGLLIEPETYTGTQACVSISS